MTFIMVVFRFAPSSIVKNECSCFCFDRFMYSDEIAIDAETVASTLYAANKYMVDPLVQACLKYLKDNVNAENVDMWQC